MSALPSPTFANVFQNYFKTHCFTKRPDNVKPQFNKRYLDDKYLFSVMNSKLNKF